jgi:hypothetical protein
MAINGNTIKVLKKLRQFLNSIANENEAYLIDKKV